MYNGYPKRAWCAVIEDETIRDLLYSLEQIQNKCNGRDIYTLLGRSGHVNTTVSILPRIHTTQIMYGNTLLSTVAALALVTNAVIAAPVPPHFPGVSFHGAPQPSPSSVDYEITNGNGTVFSPQSTGSAIQEAPNNGVQSDGIDFAKLNITQLEQLQNALLGNYTLPLLNLTETILYKNGPRLLATLVAQLDNLGNTVGGGVQQSQTEASGPTSTVGAAAVKQLSEIDDLIKAIQGMLPRDNAGLIRREEKVMIAGKPVSFPLDPSEY